MYRAHHSRPEIPVHLPAAMSEAGGPSAAALGGPGATFGTIVGTVGGSALGVHFAEQAGKAGIGYFSNEVQQAYQRDVYNLANRRYRKNKA
jgi:hypothetical protein